MQFVASFLGIPSSFVSPFVPELAGELSHTFHPVQLLDLFGAHRNHPNQRNTDQFCSLHRKYVDIEFSSAHFDQRWYQAWRS